jgi:hypothetical protein
MLFSLTDPAQLHRHIFTTDAGIPQPPLRQGTVWQCLEAWVDLPASEQPFHFVSMPDGNDMLFDELMNLEFRSALTSRGEQPAS